MKYKHSVSYVALVATHLLCIAPSAQSATHKFTIGFDAMRYRYTEATDQNPKLMSLQSNQFGLYGAYTLSHDAWFVKPEATLNYGYAKYNNKRKPQYMGASQPTWLFEGRLLGGYDFNVLDGLTVSPYIGIGYKHRHEDAQLTDDYDHGKTDDTDRSLRVNRSWYIPLGVKAQYTLSEKWFLNALAEYDHRFWGKHYHFAKQEAPSPCIYNQHKAWGIMGELTLGYHFEKNTLEIGPYINFWKAQDSNKLNSKKYIRHRLGVEGEWTSTGSYEPRNELWEIGLRLRVTF